MYHFVATCAPEPLELSEKVQIPGHIRQYLKEFQVDTLQFLHKHLANRDFCILNDESGLGKCVSTAVYLGAIAKNKRCLIVVQNDDELVTGWQFHFDVLTKLSVGVLGPNTSSLETLPNIIIAKWATLRATVDGSKFNFDYVVIDNRGQMMSNNFCLSMLLSNYEQKVNLLISSTDVTSDLKLLHNSLRLGGRLEHQYEQFKVFEAKYKLPNSKDVLNKMADLEEYFLKREMISDFCKDFRLRRYRHQFEGQLPFVDAERYKISLELWRTISSSNSSQKSNDNCNNLNANSETATEELFNHALALNNEISQILDARRTQVPNSENNDASEDAVIMSPLLIDSESCTSDEPEEVINIENSGLKSLTQNKQTEPDIYEFVDLSTEQCSEEYNSKGKKEKQKTTIQSKEYQSRSLAQDNNNKKTNDIDKAQEGVTTNNLTEKLISEKKTKLQKNCKIVKANEMNVLDNEGTNKSLKGNTNTSTDSNENITVLSPQIKNRNDTKQADVSTKAKPQRNHNKTVAATKRRTIKSPEKKVSNKNSNKEKIYNKEKMKPAASTKHCSLEQKQQENKDMKKLTVKEGYRNSKCLNETKDVSKKENGERVKPNNKDKDSDAPSTRRSAKEQTQRKSKEKEKLSDKKHSKHDSNTKETKNAADERKIDRHKEDEETTTESKQGEPKNNETKEISTRCMRQLRSKKDGKDMGKKEFLASPKKKARLETSSPKTSSKKSKSMGATENKSPNDSAKIDVEKQKRTRAEVLRTPTIRNTRSMQRTTRSSDRTRCIYMKSPSLLERTKKIRKKIFKEKDICSKDENKTLETNTPSKSKGIEKRKSLHPSNDDNKKPRSTETKRQKANYVSKDTENSKDSAMLPCSDNTEVMQCAQKISGSSHSDNEFLRPPTPNRITRNSEPKQFLTTPCSFTDSEVVFVPSTYAPNKSQAILILSSSTDDASLSSQQSEQSRRTRALKQKKALKRPATAATTLADPTTTPSFGELLAKQRIQRKSPDLFSASTDLGLTCTQQLAADRHDGVETFQGFKIFGSEVKQIQQQIASTSSGRKSAPVTSRGRSCLNLLEKMFEPTPADVVVEKSQAQHKKSSNMQKATKKVPDDKLVKRSTRGSQPVVPSLPNIVNATQNQGLSKQDKEKECNKTSRNSMLNGSLAEEEIFEITNNDAFGSMMRINSNGEISPVQLTTRSQQTTQHNKITNYLIGSTQLTPTEAVLDERTPSKRTPTQPQSGTAARRSPKGKSTQTTKLTKWFQKNGAINEIPVNSEHGDIRMKQVSRSGLAKRLKRRCLELSFRN